MRSGTAFVSLAVGALALAGCGGTHVVTVTASTPTTTAPAHVEPSANSNRPVRTTSYTVELSGAGGTTGEYPAPRGEPNASGVALISINSSTNELCWNFTRLTITPSTVPDVYRRTAGAGSWRYGIPLGGTYKPEGCVHIARPTLGLIEEDPGEWWVSLRDAKFPKGAIRAQV